MTINPFQWSKIMLAIWIAFAEANYEKGNLANARKWLLRVLGSRRGQESIQVHMLMSDVLYRSNDYEQAISCLKTANSLIRRNKLICRTDAERENVSKYALAYCQYSFNLSKINLGTRGSEFPMPDVNQIDMNEVPSAWKKNFRYAFTQCFENRIRALPLGILCSPRSRTA